MTEDLQNPVLVGCVRTQVLIVESSRRGGKNAGAPRPAHRRIPDRR